MVNAAVTTEIKFHKVGVTANDFGRESSFLWFISIPFYCVARLAATRLTACGPNEVGFLPIPHCSNGVSRVHTHTQTHTHTHTHTYTYTEASLHGQPSLFFSLTSIQCGQSNLNTDQFIPNRHLRNNVLSHVLSHDEVTGPGKSVFILEKVPMRYQKWVHACTHAHKCTLTLNGISFLM